MDPQTTTDPDDSIAFHPIADVAAGYGGDVLDPTARRLIHHWRTACEPDAPPPWRSLTGPAWANGWGCLAAFDADMPDAAAVRVRYWGSRLVNATGIERSGSTLAGPTFDAVSDSAPLGQRLEAFHLTLARGTLGPDRFGCGQLSWIDLRGRPMMISAIAVPMRGDRLGRHISLHIVSVVGTR